MSGPSSRRGFLRGLTTLPLIGGGVALIGNPTAAAVPVTGQTVATYLTWLHYEFRYVSWGCGQPGYVPMLNHGAAFHDRERSVALAARAAIHRAPVVLATVGCPMTCPRGEDQASHFGPEHWQEGVR